MRRLIPRTISNYCIFVTLTKKEGLIASVGEDPLVDDQSDHDINSVAGVLKLYFRGLEKPLFPKEHFLDLISTTSESSSGQLVKHEAVLRFWEATHCLFL